MHEPLKNCPFCGCKAMASINKGESLWSHDVVDWTRVHCTNDECNAQTEATCEGYEPSAIEVWNRRTPQPVVREPLTDEQVDALIATKHFREGYELTASDKVCINWYRLGLRDGERAHGITQKGGS